MEQEYINSLSDQLTLECNTFGEEITINGFDMNALVSTSATTKNLQVAGFYKNQTLDVVAPLYSDVPKLNNIISYNNKTYQIKQIENLEYNSGYRLTMELVP